jgi:hypothetical protein
MLIERYSFGSITIEGTTYSRDVIIYPDRVFSPWWRKEGHLLHMEDLDEVLKEKPDILVIGQGNMGVMSVPRKLINELRSQGIEIIAERTGKAVDTYNKLKGKHVIAALHLTC